MKELKPDEIFCVYCLKVKPRPAKGEHIILKGLGGRATILDVCGGPDSCNQKLGDELDREVLRNSHIALHRYYDPKVTKGQIGGTQKVPTKLGGLHSTVFNDGSIRLAPQVVLVQQGPFVAAENEDQAAVIEVCRGLKDVDALFDEVVRDLEEYDPPRLMVDLSKKGRHAIRGRTQADVDRVKDVLKQGIEFQYKVDPQDLLEPEMQIKISMEFNTVSRCMAKMAFNFATALFGAQVMAGPDFSPIRAFILGDDVQVKPLRKMPNGAIIAELDERFVDRWVDRPPATPQRPTTEHYMQLLEIDGQLGAQVVLIGGAEPFQIRLGPLATVDRTRLPAHFVRTDDDDYLYVGSHIWGTDKMKAGLAWLHRPKADQ